MNPRIYRLALARSPGFGRAKRSALLEFFGSEENIFRSSAKGIVAACGADLSAATALLSQKTLDAAAKELEKTDAAGLVLLFPQDEGFPMPFVEIDDMPPVVCVGGRLRESDYFSVAVVGSRRATPYGLASCRRLALDLGALGVATVSGLARGIDTEAHLASIESGARTVAVLGNGFGHCYPPENRKLQRKICDGAGAVISEYAYEQRPDKFTFPRRNRLISALSLATLVVEADEKSGALITARHALEQGKEVFAVPGGIFSKYSRGPHSLIKQGAKLVQSAEDIIEELAPIAEWLRKRAASVSARPCGVFDGNAPSSMPRSAICAEIDPSETRILDALGEDISGVSIEFIETKTGIRAGELSGRLLKLELKGVIRSLPGKCYALSRAV